MTDEEKSKEIVKSAMAWWEDADYTIKDIEEIMTNSCCQMATWKEQQMIDKACKYLTPLILCMNLGNKPNTDKFIEDFKQAMKGEQDELYNNINKLHNGTMCKGEVIQDAYNRNLYIKCKAPKTCKWGDKIKVILLNNDTERKEHN